MILTYLGEFSSWYHRCEQTPGPISPIDELIVFVNDYELNEMSSTRYDFEVEFNHQLSISKMNLGY